MSESVKYDIKGTAVITDAIIDLLNEYPGLEDDEITFADMNENGGITIMPVSGATIETERQDITDHVTQICLYPFYVMYREQDPSEERRIELKEWLDNLGIWLEKQTVMINEEAYRLDSYPELSGERKFLSIERQTPAYMDSKSEDGTEDWVVYISARYQNEFNR